MNDPIIDEIYKMREQLAKEHHFSLDSLYNTLKEKRKTDKQPISPSNKTQRFPVPR